MPYLVAMFLQFFLRKVVIGFIATWAIFALSSLLVPMMVGYIAPYVVSSSLTSAFSGLGSSVWFFVDFFNLSFGLPLVISAYVARFLVRRLPIIG